MRLHSALICALLATPAVAQIQMLKHGSSQGSVAPAATASSSYSCETPTAGSTNVIWNGRKWSMRNGRAWNIVTPYAVCFGTTDDYVRFELRDSQFDHGANDETLKRRAEIGNNAGYRNGVTYWMAFSVKTHVDGLNKSLGNTMDQFQDPLGSSPSISHRLVYCTTSPSLACLRTTTRYDEDGQGGATVNRGQVPFALDVPHDIVVQFQMGANGFERTWLDGQLVSQYSGPIGTTMGDGYGLRIGTYGQPLGGMSIVQEYKNIAPFPSTTNLADRTAGNLVW